MNNNVEESIKVFNQGGIVIFPTDTVWGIGCRMDLPESIDKLYGLRKRPNKQASPVLVSSKEQAREYFLAIPEKMEKLIDTYWPGGLTIIYKAQVNKIPSLVRANSDTIGLRMPDHKELRSIINSIGVPILGSSANFHGEKTPINFSDLNPQLVNLVDYVLPGECGGKQSSTVIDCTKEPWQIIRQGAVRVEL